MVNLLAGARQGPQESQPDARCTGVSTAARERYETDQTRGVTVFGDLRCIVEKLRVLRVPISEVEFLPSCEWAVYVRPGVMSPERSAALRASFQVAVGRC